MSNIKLEVIDHYIKTGEYVHLKRKGVDFHYNGVIVRREDDTLHFNDRSGPMFLSINEIGFCEPGNKEYVESKYKKDSSSARNMEDVSKEEQK